MSDARNTVWKAPALKRPPVTIVLDVPIEFPGFGEPVKEITIRPYSGEELISSGMPFHIERNIKKGTMKEVADTEACAELLCHVTGYPKGVIKQLVAVDFFQAVEVLKGFFFTKTPETSSTNISTSVDGAETASLSSD